MWILHIGILPLRIVLLSALLGPCVVGAQSPAPSEVATRPVIIGSLDKGKYSNPMIGFELQLDAPCAFADEDRAIAWSTQFSQRLNLSIRCGDNLVLLSSLPLHADEKVDLRRDAQVSLEGAMGGGGFKRRGHWQNQAKLRYWCRNSFGTATRDRNLASIKPSWLAEDMYRSWRLVLRRTKQHSVRLPQN